MPDIVYSEPCRTAEDAMRSIREKRAPKPRLTVGIPTYNRTEMLPTAIDSALAQTVPIRVIVADDGDVAKTDILLRGRYPEHLEEGRIVHLRTGAHDLWPNWDACARACDTEFFLWLQDDDVIQEYTAARAIEGFDKFPEADTWMAPNKLAMDDKYIWWNNGNGPWVPLHRHGIADQWEGEIFAPTCYFLSWSLSPGVAFRCGGRFTKALDWMPMDCDIFAERLILVAMGGRFIADPYVAGLWIQHRENISRQHHHDQPRQSKILIAKLDEAMDRIGEDKWREVLSLWCRLQHPQWIAGWLGDLEHVQREGGKSRYGKAIYEVMFRSLEGRVRMVPRYKWWRRAINRAVSAVNGKAAL